ncbi:[FeFe] hydrogenase H-cluster radical SAM maturase HydG [Candidatus Gracilibacteria bacterium]|nr:[FeFe] hydrogenase H-cluster radical SAM maturase HydG [Candidatus Gracilibacteria bacterium]
MGKVTDIIDEGKINGILEKTKSPNKEKVLEILTKASLQKGLDLEEIGYLLHTKDKDLWKQIFSIAKSIKEDIYGERLVFFAPLYISSYCVNDCEYCAFHCRNNIPRKKLTLKEVEEQTKQLIDMGHKRLLLEFGEHPTNDIDYIIDVIKTIYATKHRNGEIRRVNVNIAATTVEDYIKLKEVGIGTYQLFQETYHRETYEKMHPRGPKSDYERQLFAHDRAFAGGIDDIGLGVLFGLYDYKFEVLSLVSHAQYLDQKYNVGPHTLSVPRFQPADTVDIKLEHAVSEEELLKIIAILRLAVPYTGMIISTREKPETRSMAFEIGISQTSAASCTSPGGYGKEKNLEQFNLSDHRNLGEVIEGIMQQGLLPSFCTACYREGRTGEDFMHIAKPGEIHNLCRPNAILTLKEYLIDYATPEVKNLGEKIIEKYLAQISDKGNRRKETEERLERIEKGERDLYF